MSLLSFFPASMPLINKWLECHPHRGKLRFLFVIFAIWFFVIIGNILFGNENAISTIERWVSSYPNLGQIPQSILWFFWILFPHLGLLEFFMIPLGIFWLVLIISTRYTQKVKGLSNFTQAFHYQFTVIFGWFTPEIKINEKGEDESPTNDWIRDFGGPGFINIDGKIVVVLENLKTPTRFLTKGKHYITRFEKIREIINLPDQPLRIDELSFYTKDRVNVKVKQIALRYKVATPKISLKIGDKSDIADNIPKEAIYHSIYNRWNGVEGYLEVKNLVQEIIESAIRFSINDMVLIRLMSPDKFKGHPRDDIYTRVKSPKIKGRLNEIGTTIEWFDYETIEIPEEYQKIEPLNSWHAYWIRRTAEIRASGEARRNKQKDENTLQRQAEALIKIAEIFQNTSFSPQISGSDQELFWKAVSSVINSIK